jgi:hypothetical protein
VTPKQICYSDSCQPCKREWAVSISLARLPVLDAVTMFGEMPAAGTVFKTGPP